MSLRLHTSLTQFDLTAMHVSCSDDEDDDDSIIRIEDEYDSDDDDDESSTASTSNDDDYEDALVKSMVQDAFSGRISNNDLKRFLQEDNDDSDMEEMRCTKRARISTSPGGSTPERSLVKAVSCDQIQYYCNNNTIDYSIVNPEHHLQSILKANDYKFCTYSAQTIPHFFVDINDESTIGYDTEYLNAINMNDTLKLRHMMEIGHNMQCSNRFGETIIHFACRRGLYYSFDFLLHEANVTIKVKCDNGRTPLHEACWTAKPNWNIITLVLDHCPDLLYITDNRGHTPLAYVPKEVWSDWCQFLNSRDIEQLKRREI